MIEFFSQYPEMLVIVLFVWYIVGLIIEGVIAEKLTNEILIFHPADFYEEAKMNWFGSWVCFILLVIVNPFGFFVKLILYFVLLLVYLAQFIQCLFTVGREDD